MIARPRLSPSGAARLCAGGAWLALAACSGEAASLDDAVLADAPAPLPPAPAAAPPPAPDLPGPAAGRWTYTISRGGQTLPADSRCMLDRLPLDEAYALLREPGADCGSIAFRLEGASILGAFACGETRTEVTITGNLASAWTMTEVVSAPEAAPVATTIIAQRTGECSGAPPPPLVPAPQDD